MAARIAPVLALAALLFTSHGAPAAADLTDTERRWLAGATPPVAWALKQGMPIDIVVLPQAQPGAAPIAMGYDEGRCKLSSRCAATQPPNPRWHPSLRRCCRPRSKR